LHLAKLEDRQEDSLNDKGQDKDHRGRRAARRRQLSVLCFAR
jgi:hypothetical protein